MSTLCVTGPTLCVIGPHSSGTRLMARVARDGLERHGWEIYHRSLPGSWPTRGSRFVWIERDAHCTMASQIRNGHARNIDEAHDNLTEAKQQFHLMLSQGMDVLTVHYDELRTNPDRVIWNLANWMDVGVWDFGEPLFDGDAQYRDMNLADVRPKPEVGVEVRGGATGPGASVGVSIPQVRASGNA